MLVYANNYESYLGLFSDVNFLAEKLCFQKRKNKKFEKGKYYFRSNQNNDKMFIQTQEKNNFIWGCVSLKELILQNFNYNLKSSIKTINPKLFYLENESKKLKKPIIVKLNFLN